jgi:hypothetical protein
LLEESTAAARVNTAVDLGSGNGRYAIALAKRGFRTDSIEWTHSGIAESMKNCNDHGVEISCQRADFLRVAHEHRKYGLVLSSGLLEELPREAHAYAVRGHLDWARSTGIVAIKYCVEIVGRGELVDPELVPTLFKEQGATILHHSVDPTLKRSKSNMIIKTATIIGRRN